MLVIAVETVPDAELPATVDALMKLAAYLNGLKPYRGLGLTLPA
jgi:hypothetical protein